MEPARKRRRGLWSRRKRNFPSDNIGNTNKNEEKVSSQEVMPLASEEVMPLASEEVMPRPVVVYDSDPDEYDDMKEMMGFD